MKPTEDFAATKAPFSRELSAKLTEDFYMDDKTLPRDTKLIPRSRDLRNHATKQENHL